MVHHQANRRLRPYFRTHHAWLRAHRLVLANLPATAHAFETVAETHLFIPYTNLDLPIGHWAQDGLLTIFFLTVGLELKQELTTGSLANPKAAAVPMLCAVGGMIAPPILFLAVTALFSQIGLVNPAR